MEGLTLGDDDKKEPPAEEAKAEAKAEKKAEQVEEDDDTSSTSSNSDSIEDEETFIFEGAPEILLCPITTTLLVSPVLAADGYIYEEHAIHEWFATCKRKGNEITSPKTGANMADMTMPNLTHKIQVREYVDAKKEEWKIICAEKEDRGKGKGRGKSEKK